MDDTTRLLNILQALHGMRVIDAQRLLSEAMHEIREQGNQARVDKDHTINADLAAFGITSAQRKQSDPPRG